MDGEAQSGRPRASSGPRPAPRTATPPRPPAWQHRLVARLPARETRRAYAGLALALIFVVLVTYLPHMDTRGMETEGGPWVRFAAAYGGFLFGDRDDYEYPLHVDEPMHWARMANLQRTDALHYGEPYSGERSDEIPLSLRGLVHEKGFYVAFAGYQDMSGISWFDLIRMVPALWAGLTAWLVFAALRPWKGAPLAAALVAFIPTTPRFLGTAFFVPIGIGMAWLALALLLMRHAGTDRRTLLMLLLVGTWAFFIHLIAGFAIVIALLVAVPFFAAAERRNALLLALGTILPILWLYEGFRPSVEDEFQRIGFLPTDFTAFDLLGIPFLIAWVLGVTWVAQRPPRATPARIPIVAATIASAATFIFIVGGQAFDLNRYALYDRWHQPFALFAAVPVAYAIVGLYELVRDGVARLMAPGPEHARRIDLRRDARRIGRVATTAGLGVAILAGGVVATPSLDQHLEEPYYHVLTDEDFGAFQRAKDTPDTYDLFLTHPWKAPVFHAMTGRQPYTWLQPGSPPIRGDEYATYLRTGHQDPLWLVERGISMVVAPDVPPDSPHYERDATGAWLADPQLAQRMYDLRHGR